MSFSKFVPAGIRSWFKRKTKNAIYQTELPLAAIKYMPYKQGADSYILPKSGISDEGYDEFGLAIPPADIWGALSISKEAYFSTGKEHASKMLEVVKQSGFSFAQGNRILDLGCGAGRMMRHLHGLSDLCEIWGADINSVEITWAKQFLSPPFHFATTTTIPHLPFEDRYFNFIYCGSLFTHIEDLAEAWLCELKRILAPGGRLYITIHDYHTIELFKTKYKDFWLPQKMNKDAVFAASKGEFGMLTIGRDAGSQVFYDAEYFCRTLKLIGFNILCITPEAYAYQTAVLVERR